MKDVWIIIPAFNEEKSLGKVVRDLKKGGYKNIIVIDDGSEDRTSSIAKKQNVITLRHPINRGLGGALGTGMQAAYDLGAQYAVTFDADGQHAVSDLKKVLKPLQKGEADVIIGSRLINSKGMPVHRKVGNWGFNVITYLLFGVWTTDSQSGFRAFSRNALSQISIKTNRMEVSSEIIKEIGRNNLAFKEVPIKAIYTDYSLEHGQSSLNAFRILFKLILRKVMK